MKIIYYLQIITNKKKIEVKVLKKMNGYRKIKTDGVHVHAKRNVKIQKEDIICCILEWILEHPQ